ncbi:MAG: radical SAM protein [Promethearchaeota archaeon]|nr:MAG: radical SAM protein [Candidatus Lokiarchaeota archaeon]
MYRFKHYQPKPNHPDWEKLQIEVKEIEKKILQNIKIKKDIGFRYRINNFYRKLSSVRTVLLNFLRNRYRYSRKNHALFPPSFVWAMINRCNFHCTYCDDHTGKAWPENSDIDTLNTKEGLKLLKLMRTGTSSVYFCGGEPTLRKDLPFFIDKAWNMGFWPVAINTNASVLHKKLLKPEWSNVLRQLDIMVISLDALDIDLLNNLYQVKMGRTVIRNILLLRYLSDYVPIFMVVNVVISRDNILEAEAVLDWCNDLDIPYAIVPAQVKSGADPKVMQDPNYKKLAKKVLQRQQEGYRFYAPPYLLRKILYQEPHECFKSCCPHIFPNGTLYWPCQASVNVKPVKLKVLDYKTLPELYKEANKRIAAYNFHGSGPNQCGGSCGWYQIYGTEVVGKVARENPIRLLQEIRNLPFKL